ncbi:hypothetical protein C8J57DRAFT_1471950 [Mycena rebaudengoi]|nr:hypothetical protein C8J57DRAFT_1471950 [Mycena rebaudengoi]
MFFTLAQQLHLFMLTQQKPSQIFATENGHILSDEAINATIWIHRDCGRNKRRVDISAWCPMTAPTQFSTSASSGRITEFAGVKLERANPTPNSEFNRELSLQDANMQCGALCKEKRRKMVASGLVRAVVHRGGRLVDAGCAGAAQSEREWRAGADMVCGAGGDGVSSWEKAGRRISDVRHGQLPWRRDLRSSESATVSMDHGRRGVVGVELPLHASSDDEKKGGACEQSKADSIETEFPPYGDIKPSEGATPRHASITARAAARSSPSCRISPSQCSTTGV